MGAATLLRARQVHSLDPATPDADALLVADGRVLRVGRAADLAVGHLGPVLDLDGVVTPGLVDGHSHPVTGLAMTAGVDLTDVLDLEEVRAALAAERDRLAPGQWLQGWALNPVVFGRAEPSAAALGPALAGVPALVRLYDGHSVVVSAPALALAGIVGPRVFASSARIACDEHGLPTGYLLEAEAADLVEAVRPPTSLDRQADDLHALLRGMARTGLTGLHAMDFQEPSQQVVQLLEEHTDLPVRMGFRPMLMPGADGIGAVLAQQGLHGRRWLVDGVKLVVDGTIDGGTAWLEHPDTHGEGLASLWTDPVAFRAAVTGLHRAGVAMAVHAIGDRGVRETLTLLEELRTTYGPLARHRIEHVETLPAQVIAGFGRGVAAASMQPLHLTAFNNAERTDSWSLRLGDERVDRGFPWAPVRVAGGVLALGSDWPIAPYDPRWAMADVQLRRRFDRPEAAPMNPSSALTSRQALEGYTTHAALAAGEQDHRGMLAPGYDADLTVFAEDPLTLDPGQLGTVGIVSTLVAGQPVC